MIRIPLAAKLFLGFVAAIFIIGVSLELMWLAQHNAYDRYPLDKACYTLVDRTGNEYKSWFPPVPAGDMPGTYTFNNDHTWGYVFGASAAVVDRDCLRERYPGDTMVPPLDGEDR